MVLPYARTELSCEVSALEISRTRSAAGSTTSTTPTLAARVSMSEETVTTVAIVKTSAMTAPESRNQRPRGSFPKPVAGAGAGRGCGRVRLLIASRSGR